MQCIDVSKIQNKIEMRGILLSILLGLLLASCTPKWEYKIVAIKGNEKVESPRFDSKSFDISDESLNLFGRKGWELVDVYSKIETVHPNFGNSEYVSGLQPNVRVEEICFVFKRKK